MKPKSIRISEGQLKAQVNDYLQYKMNAGELYYDRLNSGDYIELRGETRRRIKGCRKGTADFYVLQGTFPFTAWNILVPRIIFLELKSETGRQSPEQKDFQQLVEAQGAEYYIIKSIADIEEVV